MLKGIDISTWNVVNDYAIVANQIDFAIVKATQGHSVTGDYSYFTDSKFIRHLTGLTDKGVDCGVYHYLTAKTVDEAKREAEYFCSIIAPYKHRIKLWAAVDVEEKKYLPLNNRALLTTIVTAFCQVVESKGFKPMVYTNPDFLTNHMVNIPQYDLWLALWRDVNNVPSLTTYPNMQVWQYTSVGRVDSIVGNVDMNIGFYKTEEVTDMANDNNIKDINVPSDWAKADWDMATQMGITDGTRPKANITREEAIVMIHRALGIAKSKLK